jgi:hypothetical protein
MLTREDGPGRPGLRDRAGRASVIQVTGKGDEERTSGSTRPNPLVRRVYDPEVSSEWHSRARHCTFTLGRAKVPGATGPGTCRALFRKWRGGGVLQTGWQCSASSVSCAS